VGVVGALLIALLAYGVLRQAPDSTIDDTLAAGRPIAARSFSTCWSAVATSVRCEPGWRGRSATGVLGSRSCVASRSC